MKVNGRVIFKNYENKKYKIELKTSQSQKESFVIYISFI